MNISRFNLLSLVIILFFPVMLSAQQTQTMMRVWPNGMAPGEPANPPAEKDNTKPTDNKPGNRPVIRLTNVSDPTLTVFPADEKKNSGTAVIVCPGGGYSILAMDLEGTEICEYLSSLGITAILLKYRVPAKAGQPRYQAPLQDAQRAMGMVRSYAKTLNIDSTKIGIMGFSAGGHLSAALSNNYSKRTYPRIDKNDDVSCRPDFAILIYPAYLVVAEQGDKISPELPVTSNTPPTFLVQTEDDGVRVENSLHYYLALKKEKVPAEMHLYAKGGHGYGMRDKGTGIETWPERLKEWLMTNKLIK